MMNAIKIVFIIIILGSSNSLFANENLLASRNIKIINVFSGAPQPGDGPSKLAGFGDVAANLVAATEIKKRNPELQVRLIVTSAEERFDPLIPTTNEILKIMEPELDPKKKDVVQICKGIEVVFLSYDFANALDESKIHNLTQMFKDMASRLPKLIPNADLNLNFSYFPESASVIRINAPLAMGVEELYGSDKPINSVLSKNGEKNQGAFVELSSGSKSIGFMLVKEKMQESKADALIRNWAQTANVPLPQEDFNPLMAYSAGWQSVQVYIDALSALQKPGRFVLFAKSFPELDISKLPKNITFVPIKGMPHEVMSAIIQESALSPMVTGDISLGQALSSATGQKTFVYEAPEWKLDNAEGIQKTLTTDLNLKPSDLEPLFLNVEKLMKLNRDELLQKGLELARLMGDEDLQKRLYGALLARRDSWDVLSNTLQIAQGILNPSKNQVDQSANEIIAEDAKKRLSTAHDTKKLPLAFIVQSKFHTLLQRCNGVLSSL